MESATQDADRCCDSSRAHVRDQVQGPRSRITLASRATRPSATGCAEQISVVLLKLSATDRAQAFARARDAGLGATP